MLKRLWLNAPTIECLPWVIRTWPYSMAVSRPGKRRGLSYLLVSMSRAKPLVNWLKKPFTPRILERPNYRPDLLPASRFTSSTAGPWPSTKKCISPALVAVPMANSPCALTSLYPTLAPRSLCTVQAEQEASSVHKPSSSSVFPIQSLHLKTVRRDGPWQALSLPRGQIPSLPPYRGLSLRPREKRLQRPGLNRLGLAALSPQSSLSCERINRVAPCFVMCEPPRSLPKGILQVPSTHPAGS